MSDEAIKISIAVVVGVLILGVATFMIVNARSRAKQMDDGAESTITDVFNTDFGP